MLNQIVNNLLFNLFSFNHSGSTEICLHLFFTFHIRKLRTVFCNWYIHPARFVAAEWFPVSPCPQGLCHCQDCGSQCSQVWQVWHHSEHVGVWGDGERSQAHRNHQHRPWKCEISARSQVASQCGESDSTLSPSRTVYWVQKMAYTPCFISLLIPGLTLTSLFH